MDNIRILRKQKNLSQHRLAEICGVHQTAVSQWEQGRTKPDLDSVLKMSALFGLSVDELLMTESGRRTHIPLLGSVRSGANSADGDDVVSFVEITADMAGGGEHFAVRVVGEAMRPVFTAGDVLIIRRQDDVNSGELALVRIGRDGAVPRRIIKKGTSMMLVPFNTDFEPLMYTGEELAEKPVEIFGKIVELRRRYPDGGPV